MLINTLKQKLSELQAYNEYRWLRIQEDQREIELINKIIKQLEDVHVKSK